MLKLFDWQPSWISDQDNNKKFGKVDVFFKINGFPTESLFEVRG